MIGYYTKFKIDDIGQVFAAKTPRGISAISFERVKSVFLRSLPRHITWIEDCRHFAAIKKKIHRLLKSKGSSAEIALDLSGTKFQQAVWKKIAEIPYGETRSYAWLARAVGKPKGYRAAANACGANPVPIVIPCHRVISSNGSIGGFSAGPRLKKKLLGLEGSKTVQYF